MKSKLFQFCKQFIPPVIWNFVRGMAIGDPPKSLTYTGTFASFSEVLANCADATNYHSEQSELGEFEGARSKLLKLESGQVPEKGPSNPRLNFLPTALSLFPQASLNILDVGGGLGTTFIDLKFCLPTKTIEVTVVELSSIVESGRKLFQEYPGIEFVSAIPKGKERRFDVVYFGSSLQYFENYLSVLADSASLAPEFIIIADTTMGPAPAFVCAQVNMGGRVIPKMVFNKLELIEALENGKYHLVHQSVNYWPAHTFDNYEPPARLTSHWNLVFERDA